MTASKRQAKGTVRAWRRAALCALIVLLWAGPAPMAKAQAPAAPAEAAPGAPAGPFFYRIVFLSLDQYSFQNHPFFQITADSDFKDGDATTSITSIETPATAANDNIVLKGIHSLPNFGLEYGEPYDFIFPKSWVAGFDYHRFSQTDLQALDTDKPVVTIPRISMDFYMYSFYLRGYAFDASEPGINYYVGFGLGYLEGKFDATPYAGAREERVGFSMLPIGFTQLGVEARGENFGIRYEVRLVRARQVDLDSNPYLDQEDVTQVNFSGSLIKIAAFYHF
jgi:hypothetical protein